MQTIVLTLITVQTNLEATRDNAFVKKGKGGSKFYFDPPF